MNQENFMGLEIPQVELLNLMVVSFVIFSETILFFLMPVPTYIPINSVQGSLFSTFSSILAILLIIAILGVRQYLTVILICISLMTSNVEHIFTCLLATYMSFLGKRNVFQVFCPFFDQVLL